MSTSTVPVLRAGAEADAAAIAEIHNNDLLLVERLLGDAAAER